ncbi:MAG TPA: hypothetical protein ENJ18_14385 [Nannocystis exedens]|nr:hypothetical protein [Nannocystis exedens]
MSFEGPPLAAGTIGIAEELTIASSVITAGAPQSQSQSPKGGQSQSQGGQSQEQALPDPDDDLEIEDDPFFADEPSPVVAPQAPIEAPAPSEQVIEIEVPEGYSVEYEIVEDPATPATPATPAVPLVPAVPSVRAQPARKAAPSMTIVNLRSWGRVAVERFDAERGHWVPVCVAPCRARVPAGSQLRVPSDRAYDQSRSARFELPKDSRQLALDVRAGSRKQRRAGIGLALMSATGVAAGAIMLGNTAYYEDPARRSYEGFVVAGMGAVTLIAGIGMAIAGKSRIRKSRADARVALRAGGLSF